jgi:hypothetical protein
MVIDCDTCEVRHTDACDDCVVTFILGMGADALEVGPDEATALANLAEVGLLPPLRLVTRSDHAGPTPTHRGGRRQAG